MAERGVRDVHVDAGRRRVSARLGGVVPSSRATGPRRSRSTRSHGTRPIEYPVHSPDDANGMFDTLTYLKGGAILRMLEQYLGRRRGSATGSAGTWRQHELRQHRDARSVGRARRGDRRARPSDHGQLDLAGRLPADLRERPTTARCDSRSADTRRRFPTTTRPGPCRSSSARPRPTVASPYRPDPGRGGGCHPSLLAPDAVVVANAGGFSFVRVWYDDDLWPRLSAVVAASS